MRLFLATLFWVTITLTTQANTSSTITIEQRDGWRMCRDEFRALGPAIFTDRLTVKEKTLTLHFPAPIGDIFVALDDGLISQHRRALSVNSHMFGVTVNDKHFLAFPDEAALRGGVCSHTSLP